MTAVPMPRGKLVGVRFDDEELTRLDRLQAHFETTTPGVRFNAQMTIKRALALVEEHLELQAAPKPPKSSPARKRPAKR